MHSVFILKVTKHSFEDPGLIRSGVVTLPIDDERRYVDWYQEMIVPEDQDNLLEGVDYSIEREDHWR